MPQQIVFLHSEFCKICLLLILVNQTLDFSLYLNVLYGVRFSQFCLKRHKKFPILGVRSIPKMGKNNPAEVLEFLFDYIIRCEIFPILFKKTRKIPNSGGPVIFPKWGKITLPKFWNFYSSFAARLIKSKDRSTNVRLLIIM